MISKNLLFICFTPFLLCLSCTGGFIPECEDCGFNCLKGDERKIETNGCAWFDDCSFGYYQNSKIDIRESNGFSEGDKTVFEFTSLTEAVDGIRPEVKNTLVFDYDARLGTFQINGERFKQLNVHFKRECSCGDIRLAPAISGCLAGEEQANGAWFVYGKVIVGTPSGNEEVKFEARFDKLN